MEGERFFPANLPFHFAQTKAADKEIYFRLQLWLQRTEHFLTLDFTRCTAARAQSIISVGDTCLIVQKTAFPQKLKIRKHPKDRMKDCTDVLHLGRQESSASCTLRVFRKTQMNNFRQVDSVWQKLRDSVTLAHHSLLCCTGTMDIPQEK